MLWQFYLLGDESERLTEWVINGLIKVGANVPYHGRKRQVRGAAAVPMAEYYRAVLG